jgi:hypothetical protein
MAPSTPPALPSSAPTFTLKNTAAEFIVEFLGSLVPGGTFLLAMIPALILPMGTIIHDLFPSWSWRLPELIENIPPTVSTILILLFPGVALFLVLAYIAGHLLYRQNPKWPDDASFKRIPRSEHPDGMVRADIRKDTRVEFPYSHLRAYLEDRDLKYLSSLVPWDAVSDTNMNRRCKHWINALKIRIAIEYPSSLGAISRNEAHVRLSSSMWYVSLVLLSTSILSTLIYIITIVLTHAFPVLPTITLRPVILAPLCVLVVSFVTKWAIERSLHYQREREVLFILETAFWLKHTERVLKIFDGLS